MLVLGIESTCDETAVAIVKDGKEVLSSIIASQIKDHQPWSGVVPEIASRLHLKKIIPLTEEACKTAGVELKDVDLIASSNRPGLIGGLIIGTAVAKSYAWMLDKPFIGINHMEGHLYSSHITCDIEFPYVGLLVSGGHTMIIIVKSHTEYEVIGTTIDDALGEALDKVAKHYNIGYPGGPAIEKAALDGDKDKFHFPISNLYKSDRQYDVSYSGIKTAAINHLEKYLVNPDDTYTVNDIAASFQHKAFDMLFRKVKKASVDYKIPRIVVGGGVSANKYLRQMFESLSGTQVYFPSLKYATDNAAMIAAYAYHKFQEDGADGLDTGVYPRVTGFKISLVQ
jgi:N6-L-threonylcarbamoyladenine synthase